MPKYRILTVPSGKAHSKWRPSKEEAVEDAVRLGLVDRDDDDPGLLYWDPLAVIEYENDDGGTGVIDVHTGAVF